LPGEIAIGQRCFTHVDPFEDTERHQIAQIVKQASVCFTHVDPFEDTERFGRFLTCYRWGCVSPTSIRSRILKDQCDNHGSVRHYCFTHVDPFEDTESSPHRLPHPTLGRFTHVDPFEDTESVTATRRPPSDTGFTHVDPFEDTESLHAPSVQLFAETRFTHVDPFEDTESCIGGMHV